jgi:hypothetical protein
MQRSHRSIRPMTFYDDKLAQGEEIIKKSRLETSKKRRINLLQPAIPEPLLTAPAVLTSKPRAQAR